MFMWPPPHHTKPQHHICGCLSVVFAELSVFCCRGAVIFWGGKSQGGLHGLVLFVTYLLTPGMEEERNNQPEMRKETNKNAYN